MADKKFSINELLSDDELDNVAGGFDIDGGLRALWIGIHYGSNGEHGKIIDTSDYDWGSMVPKFCAKAGVDYQENYDRTNELKINGQWRDTGRLKAHKEETLKFFGSKLGIK